MTTKLPQSELDLSQVRCAIRTSVEYDGATSHAYVSSHCAGEAAFGRILAGESAIVTSLIIEGIDRRDVELKGNKVHVCGRAVVDGKPGKYTVTLVVTRKS